MASKNNNHKQTGILLYDWLQGQNSSVLITIYFSGFYSPELDRLYSLNGEVMVFCIIKCNT